MARRQKQRKVQVNECDKIISYEQVRECLNKIRYDRKADDYDLHIRSCICLLVQLDKIYE